MINQLLHQVVYHYHKLYTKCSAMLCNVLHHTMRQRLEHSNFNINKITSINQHTPRKLVIVYAVQKKPTSMGLSSYAKCFAIYQLGNMLVLSETRVPFFHSHFLLTFSYRNIEISSSYFHIQRCLDFYKPNHSNSTRVSTLFINET